MKRLLSIVFCVMSTGLFATDYSVPQDLLNSYASKSSNLKSYLTSHDDFNQPQWVYLGKALAELNKEKKLSDDIWNFVNFLVGKHKDFF